MNISFGHLYVGDGIIRRGDKLLDQQISKAYEKAESYPDFKKNYTITRLNKVDREGGFICASDVVYKIDTLELNGKLISGKMVTEETLKNGKDVNKILEYMV